MVKLISAFSGLFCIAFGYAILSGRTNIFTDETQIYFVGIGILIFGISCSTLNIIKLIKNKE